MLKKENPKRHFQLRLEPHDIAKLVWLSKKTGKKPRTLAREFIEDRLKGLETEVEAA